MKNMLVPTTIDQGKSNEMVMVSPETLENGFPLNKPTQGKGKEVMVSKEMLENESQDLEFDLTMVMLEEKELDCATRGCILPFLPYMFNNDSSGTSSSHP